MSKEEIINLINEASSPDNMSKQEAFDFLSDIVSDLEIQMEALEIEIEEE